MVIMAAFAGSAACSGGLGDGAAMDASSAAERERAGRPDKPEIVCEGQNLPAEAVLVESLLWFSTCLKEIGDSSVALRDLDADGVADVVIAGRIVGDQPGVVALNGTDGTPLWQSDAGIRMVTVAQFGDLNGDSTADLIAGGRGLPDDDRPLVAIDGSDGSTIWRVDPIEPAWGNVYTPQSIGDVTGDEVEDWVVATGGDHLREAAEKPTIAGRLVAIDGRSGTIIGLVALPRLDETYNSPVLVDAGGGDQDIWVGSGGEAFPGSVWRISVDDVVRSHSTGFEEIVPGGGASSFMAPFGVGDLNADGYEEVVVVRTDGIVSMLDPKTGVKAWVVDPMARYLETMPANTAIMSLAAPAIAQLDDDPQLEVVTQHALLPTERLLTGSFIEFDAAVIVLDGSTGAVEHELFVAGANSVQSPLIASTAEATGIMCACISSDSVTDVDRDDNKNEVRLAWWVPSAGEPEDLGVPASMNNTAAFGPNPEGGPGHVLVAAGRGLVTASLPLPNGRPVSEVNWGSYMGPRASGRFPR